MNREQRSKTIPSTREDVPPSLTISSTSLLSQSTSGLSSARSKPTRPSSTPQLGMVPSSSPTPPTTYPPSTDEAPDSPDSFRTPDSPPSPGLPSPASPSSTISSNQLSPTSSPRPRDQSNLDLNKPLPFPPPPSRPPSGYGYTRLPPPPPAYAPFDPHALLFTIAFPYIYASSGDANASPSPSSTCTPRYQLSTSQTRAGRPYQLALRRLTRSESRRVALAMTETAEPPAVAEAVHIPFDSDLTLYTVTYFSPRAAVPEMRGCKASTVAGRLQPSGPFPPASAGGFRAGLGRKKSRNGGTKNKGRGACWELCRLTRERDGEDGHVGGGGLGLGQKEVGTKWGYKDKDAWRREVVFAVTEKETELGRGAAAGGEPKDEAEEKREEGLVRRVRRKGSLGLSLRRGFGTKRSSEDDWTREHRRNGNGGEPDDEASSPTIHHHKNHHRHRVFEWRAGSVSLSSTTTTTNAPPPAPILPTQLLATSGSTTSTQTHPFARPIHAATAPASTLHRRPSTTALALRRVASRVSLRTAPSCSTMSTAPTFASSSAPSTTARTAPGAGAFQTRTVTAGPGEVLRVREETRRWLRLEKPLERRALDALVAAWVAGVWMECEGALG
ncbi:hypothetical protein IWZ01DRAFT_560296 [Phyllosticta capitalensis]